MILKHLPVLLLLFLFVGTSQGLYAQEEGQSNPNPQDVYQSSQKDPRLFNHEQWAKTIDGIDYSQSFRKNDDYDEDFSNTPGGEKQKQLDDQTFGGNSPAWNWFVKILCGALGLLLLFFIIYSIIKGNLFAPRSKKFNAQTQFDIETIEENIHESDLEKFIREALASENYSLAIRLYYLAIIKELIQNGDDAGANTVKLLYDRRSNSNKNDMLVDQGMKPWQGPALWVYNNAEFSEIDFENITKINAGTKEFDTKKIGKFNS